MYNYGLLPLFFALVTQWLIHSLKTSNSNNGSILDFKSPFWWFSKLSGNHSAALKEKKVDFIVGSLGQFCGLILLIFLYKYIFHWRPCFIHHIYHHHPVWLYVQHIVVRLIYKIEQYVSKLDHTYNVLCIRTLIYIFTYKSFLLQPLGAGQRALTLTVALTLLFFSWWDFDTFNYIIKF